MLICRLLLFIIFSTALSYGGNKNELPDRWVETDNVVEEITEQEKQIVFKPLLAIKSNILYGLATVPNVEIEVPIGGRWSVSGEYMHSWWVNKKHNSFAFQLIVGGVEGKFWLGNRDHRRVLTGHFIGAYTNIGIYDIQFRRDKGYQGNLKLNGGLSYGYAIPLINDRMSLEFSIGFGYVQTNYKRYHVVEDGRKLAYQYDGKYRWLGPTKAKISFIWLLGNKVKDK